MGSSSTGLPPRLRLDQATDTPRALFDAMIELYPDRVNPGSLWGGANAAKRKAGNGLPGPATAARHEETAATGGAS